MWERRVSGEEAMTSRVREGLRGEVAFGQRFEEVLDTIVA